MQFLALILIYFCGTSAVAQANLNCDHMERQRQFRTSRRALFGNSQRRALQRNFYDHRIFNRFGSPLFPLPIDTDPNPDGTGIPLEPEFVVQPIPEITLVPTKGATLFKAVVDTPLEVSAVTEAVMVMGVKEPEEDSTSINAVATVPVAVMDEKAANESNQSKIQ